MAAKVRDMTKGNPCRLILMFAVPLMIGNVFQQLYTMVDTVVVGQVTGVQALAALGAVEWIMWMVLGVSIWHYPGFCDSDGTGLWCPEMETVEKDSGT